MRKFMDGGVAAVVTFTAINLLGFFDRTALATLVEPIRKELRLSDTEVGLLASAFLWAYAAGGIPLARLGDRYSRRLILALGIAAWTALTALTGFANGFVFLLIARIGIGLGQAACTPISTSWLSDLFPAERRARVLAVFMLGVPIGHVLSYSLGSSIAAAWGWRAAMAVAAAPVVVVLPALLCLRDPKRAESEHDRYHGITTIRSILRIRTLWWIIAAGTCLNFNTNSFGIFVPAFLSRVHGLSLQQSGWATALVYVIGGSCAPLLAGILSDRAVLSHRHSRLVLAAGFAAVSAPAAYIGLTREAGASVTALIFMSIAYAGLRSYSGLVYASIHEIVPAAQRATAMAVYLTGTYLAGASFGPLLIGGLSDRMALRAMRTAGATAMTDEFKAVGLQAAMLLIPAVSILLAIVLYSASRVYARQARHGDVPGLQTEPASRPILSDR